MADKKVTRQLSIFINDKEVVNSLGGINKEITKVNNELRNLNKSSDTYDADLKRLQTTLGGLKQKQTEFRDEIYQTNTLFSKMQSLLGPVATGLLTAFSIGGIIAGFGSAVKNAFKSINEFEQSIADLSAITGATGEDLKYLKEQAIDLGEKTIGGAKQVAEAYKLIASAKPELLDNVQALNQVTEAVLLLSQASGMEMPEAATALTDALNQFNAPAEQAGFFVDALANGAKYGAAEIPQITEALLKFGAVARSSNIDIKESTGLIELLAENGIKGEMAGTALRNMLLKLSAPDALPTEAVQELKKLGVSLDFLKDKTIPIQEKLEKLKPLLKDNASIVKVFGLENASAAINVISHTERLAELTKKMGEVGSAQEQAAIKMDTVNNKTALLSAKYDSLILSIGSGNGVVSGFFKLFINGADGALTGLIRLNSSWDSLYQKAARDGQSSGKEAFQRRMNNLLGTGTDSEIAQSIKTVADRDFKLLQKQYAENEKYIAEHKNDSAYLGFGESSFLKDAKQKKESLTKSINEQKTIIRESVKEISGINKKANDAEIKATAEKTQTQIDLEKKETINKETTAEKRRIDTEKKAKEEEDRLLALAKAHADVAKAELNFFIATNKSKLEDSQKLTPDLIAEETKRLDAIKDKQLTALAEERLAKIDKATVDAKSAEELAASKLAIDYDYETARQNLELGFQDATAQLKKTYTEQEKQAAIEQLQIQNELDIAEAQTKEEQDAIRRAQAYKKELKEYKKLHDDKKITDAEYNKFLASAKLKQDELDRVAHLQKIQGTLGGLSQLAGAVGDLFGQSKELAIVQAGINGAMAVTSILAQYPKFDGGFAMYAAIAAAGISTVAQIGKIASAKPPKTPKFFYGGATGTMPYLGHDEFGAVTGVVHSNEWVAPASMTQSPKYAATFSWLENERTGNNKKFATGGETTTGTLAPFAPGAQSQDALLSAVNRLNGVLERGIKAYALIGYTEAQKIQDLNTEVTASQNNGIVS